MSIQSVTINSGVLFAQTPSGGTLMDISGDRFIALTPLSAAIWTGLAAGEEVEILIGTIMQAKRLERAEAQVLLTHQFDRWENAGLINSREPSVVPLPQPKTAPPASGTVCADKTAREPLRPSFLAKLLATEFKYRRALRKLGLARTLVLLQVENGTRLGTAEAVAFRTLRAYHALRGPLRQGRSARDCLISSIVLAAVLRRHGVQADLCIGIRDLPFSAHAWVEAQGLVLNEILSRCRRFTVIGRF